MEWLFILSVVIVIGGIGYSLYDTFQHFDKKHIKH